MNERNELIKEKGITYYNKISKISSATDKIKYFISTLEYTDKTVEEITEYLNSFSDIEINLESKQEATLFLMAYTNAKAKDNKLKANKKWQNNNKEHANYLKARSAARSFLRNKATKKDLEEFKQLIEELTKED